jgi:hypothetical protein
MCLRVKRTPQRDRAIGNGRHGPGAEGSVEHPDPNRLPRRRFQHINYMPRARSGQRGLATVVQVPTLEKNQVHRMESLLDSRVSGKRLGK